MRLFSFFGMFLVLFESLGTGQPHIAWVTKKTNLLVEISMQLDFYEL